MSIRIKVILPYLLLTLVIAVVGIYVVTKLVAGSLSERLNNQLLESGRVVSDFFARQELEHVSNARLISFTRGVGTAFLENDTDALRSLTLPVVSEKKVENLILLNMEGEVLYYLQLQSNGVYIEVTPPPGSDTLPIVETQLTSKDAENPPERQFGSDPVNRRLYYFTSLPVVLNHEMVGVIVIGTSMETIMPQLRNFALAEVIIYEESGKAFATTISAEGTEKDVFLQTISIPAQTYQDVLNAESLVIGENFTVSGREYSLARGVLSVGSDRLGIFAVVLPSNFVLEAGSTSRNTYVALFTVATIIVILIGWSIARLIIIPISSLVTTSQAIASGDLDKRTGIKNKDEIGALAQSFDTMTEKLQQRTLELEKSNKILEQMDRTKASFIHISAHELRTPLTLIQGYSYILQQMAQKDTELETVSNGLMEGFNRMEEVVNSMLDVSKIDSKSLKVSKTNIKLILVITKIHKSFKSALEERNIQFTTEGLDTLPKISADADMLYKVFYHLVMNAIKYTPDGGKIKVTGKTVDDEIEIAVCDTGIGVAPENHDLVFEKFFQTGEVMLHSSGKTKFKGGGPGLGLAIARGIIEAHGGRIWLDSPGHDEKTNPGTTVYVRLPFIRQEE